MPPPSPDDHRGHHRRGAHTAEGPTPAPTPTEAALRRALLESRNRWRDAALLAADVVIEADAEGVLTFLAPESVLGHVADHLIGEPSVSLCDLPDPWRLPTGQAVRDLRAWGRRADGTPACLLLAAAALHDAAGQVIGLRATARDVTAEETVAADAARALRRLEARDHVAARAGAIVDPRGRVQAWLEGLRDCLGLAAAAVVDLGEARDVPVTAHLAGTLPDELLALAAAMPPGASRYLQPVGAGPLALLALNGRDDRRPVLLALRAPGARDWDDDDRHMLEGIADRMRPTLAAEWRAHALEREAGTDPLTGLLNRRAFMEGLERRLARATRADRPIGALIFLDLDNFKPVNDQRGHAAGDAALRLVAALVRDGLRPSDHVGRLGGDEFAAWLEGADDDVAAMRAQVLLGIAARELRDIGVPGKPLTMSIGIAMVATHAAEDAAAILSRADAAMYAAKRRGRACWEVALAPALDPASDSAPDPAVDGRDAGHWEAGRFGRGNPER
ncbi:diguanylate cyclase domain-containing protein [Humitalea sp. 24SJ18S-53]|uniref:GGDEF domain-containing protein n=1 Tax=Humitalea sp. 24SJ18S-53 TaxID=3422307 RepID=UPI003D67650E